MNATTPLPNACNCPVRYAGSRHSNEIRDPNVIRFVDSYTSHHVPPHDESVPASLVYVDVTVTSNRIAVQRVPDSWRHVAERPLPIARARYDSMRYKMGHFTYDLLSRSAAGITASLLMATAVNRVMPNVHALAAGNLAALAAMLGVGHVNRAILGVQYQLEDFPLFLFAESFYPNL